MSQNPVIKKGYKQTEIGVIPEDWKVELIGGIASIKTGSKNTQDKKADGLYPFFVRSQTVEKIDSYSYDGEAILTAGDGVGTGKVFHYINGKFDAHQRVYRISDFDKSVNGYFIYLFFSTYFYDRIMQMTAKSSVDSVRMEMIADMQIPIPPISEQSAIASILSNTDALIGSLDKLIEKKKAIKQGTMQELLTGKRRLPGFSGDWKTVELGKIGAFSKGQGVKKDQANSGEIFCVRYGELYTHHENYIRKINSFISYDIALTSTRIKKGDILFAGSGETKEEIGKCAAYLFDELAYAGGDIILFSPFSDYSLFLSFLLNSKEVNKQKSSMGQGDAVVHISATSLKKIKVSLPKIKEEQEKIAQIIKDMDEEINQITKELEKYLKIKQAMMQQLLTGNIRVYGK